MDAYRLYSLCVAGGPRQPLGLLQDEDRSCNVIRRTLDLVWRQSQKVRSGVREFQRQIRAAGMVSVGATGHHTSHEIGYRRLHPREHGPAAAWVQAMRLRECHPTPHAPPSSSLPGRSPHGDADSRRGRKQNTQDPRKVFRHSDPSANTEIKAEQALSHTHRARLSCTAVMWQTGCCWWIWSLVAYLSEPLTVDSAGGQRCVIPMWRLPPGQGATQGFEKKAVTQIHIYTYTYKWSHTDWTTHSTINQPWGFQCLFYGHLQSSSLCFFSTRCGLQNFWVPQMPQLCWKN